MNMQTQWKRLVIGGAAALALTAGTIWTVDNVSAASATDSWSSDVAQQVMEFAGHGGDRGKGGPGMRGEGAFLGDQQQYLANALGITVEELQSAQESVRNTLIDQAVADGTLTQEQADRLKAGERLRVPGLRMKGDTGMGKDADHAALLADALGITVNELDAARVAARDAAIADALAAGTITQEQVDQMAAHQALKEYLHTQYADERPTATREALIQEALTAGAITQEQADLLLADPGHMGHGDRGELGGRGEGMRGRGHGTGAPNGQDGTTPEDNGTVPNGTQQNNDDTQESSTDSNA